MSKKVKDLQLVNVNYMDIPNNFALTHSLTHSRKTLLNTISAYLRCQIQGLPMLCCRGSPWCFCA